MLPSSWNSMAFMPPATVGMILSVWPRGFEALAHRGGDAVLDFQDRPLGPDARRLDRLLQFHAVVDQVDQRLQRRGEDLAAAGQAQRIAHLAVRSAIIGDIEVVTRLPGAIDSALPRRGSKLFM